VVGKQVAEAAVGALGAEGRPQLAARNAVDSQAGLQHLTREWVEGLAVPQAELDRLPLQVRQHDAPRPQPLLEPPFPPQVRGPDGAPGPLLHPRPDLQGQACFEFDQCPGQLAVEVDAPLVDGTVGAQHVRLGTAVDDRMRPGQQQDVGDAVAQGPHAVLAVERQEPAPAVRPGEPFHQRLALLVLPLREQALAQGAQFAGQAGGAGVRKGVLPLRGRREALGLPHEPVEAVGVVGAERAAGGDRLGQGRRQAGAGKRLDRQPVVAVPLRPHLLGGQGVVQERRPGDQAVVDQRRDREDLCRRVPGVAAAAFLPEVKGRARLDIDEDRAAGRVLPPGARPRR
jgi:hypothetical protein